MGQPERDRPPILLGFRRSSCALTGTQEIGDGHGAAGPLAKLIHYTTTAHTRRLIQGGIPTPSSPSPNGETDTMDARRYIPETAPL